MGLRSFTTLSNLTHLKSNHDQQENDAVDWIKKGGVTFTFYLMYSDNKRIRCVCVFPPLFVFLCMWTYNWFHIKSTWSAHSFNGDYLSIPEGTGRFLADLKEECNFSNIYSLINFQTYAWWYNIILKSIKTVLRQGLQFRKMFLIKRVFWVFLTIFTPSFFLFCIYRWYF